MVEKKVLFATPSLLENTMAHDSSSHDPNHLADEVDLEQYAARGEKPPLARQYVLRIDDEQHRVSSPTITRTDILKLAGRTLPEDYTVEQIMRGQPKVVCPGATIDLAQGGTERFVTRRGVTFFVDQKQVFAPSRTLTVREVLTTYAQVDPSQTTLVERQGDEQVKHPNLDEQLSIEVCTRFTVFHNTPTTVS